MTLPSTQLAVIYISTANPLRLVRVDDMNGARWTTLALPSGSAQTSTRVIALDAQGRIYVADNQNHRILRIDDISGRGLVTYGSFGNGNSQFNQPFGIAFDSRGRSYIGDEYNHRIIRMDDMTGAGWTTYGRYGTGPGRFSEPHGVAVDRLGRIYIADTGNCGSCPTCTGALEVTVDGTTPSSFVRTIVPMGLMHLDARGAGTQATGYARLRANMDVPGATIVQATNGGVVVGEAAWGPAPSLEHFTFYVDNTNGARTALLLTNPRTEDSSIRPYLPQDASAGFTTAGMTLRNKSGAVVATRTGGMGTGSQIAQDVSTLFPEAPSDFEGTVEVKHPDCPSNLSRIQATVTRYDNGGSTVFTALPVFTLPENPSRQPNLTGAFLPPSGATTVYHPLIADGGTYQTNFILFNPGDAATTATVEFFGASGAPIAIPVGGASRTQFSVSLPARSVEHVLSAGTGGDINWGWARVTAPAPIRGQAILQTQRDGQIMAETAVPMSEPTRRFAVVVTNMSTTESGIALANPNSNEISATFRLRDTNDTLAGELAVAIPGRGRLAQFVTQVFPGANEFDGTLEVEATGGLLAGIGLRYDNPGSTVFTTTPVFLLP